MEQLVILPMKKEDLPACAAIEQYAPDPWTLEQLQEEFLFESAHLFTAWQGQTIVGLAAFQLAADELTLNTITVSPLFRQQGVANSLLEQALLQLKQQGAACCFLEVRSQNLPARKLYQKAGFLQAGVRRGFYKSPADDAIVMNKML